MAKYSCPMAGPLITPIPNAAARERQPAFNRMNIVTASVSLMGREFRTNIREGASAEELIEKVARENDGGVARVFYPEFNTWEIVAVKIGSEFLVKDDPKRVAEADFSQFQDPLLVRQAALAASRSYPSIGPPARRPVVPAALSDASTGRTARRLRRPPWPADNTPWSGPLGDRTHTTPDAPGRVGNDSSPCRTAPPSRPPNRGTRVLRPGSERAVLGVGGTGAPLCRI